MKQIFEPIVLKGIPMRNRLVRSATLMLGAAKDGIITQEEHDLLVQLAHDETGLIITSMIGVCPKSCAFDQQIRAYLPGFGSDMERLARDVHHEGGAILAQLVHCGSKSGFLDGFAHPEGPSAIPETGVEEMPVSRIHEITQAFADAAQICKHAGMDGVQLHGAHGYLLSQFLSPHFNHRTDEYGGSLENRARFLYEVVDAVRARVGDTYPVLVKLNCTDLIPDGLTEDEALIVGRTLEQHGADAIELSYGAAVSPETRPAQPGVTPDNQGTARSAALRFARELHIPVISVGGYRSPEFITQTLNEGNIAAISMCRPFVCEPNLATRWHRGDLTPSRCISCNLCSRRRGCQQHSE